MNYLARLKQLKAGNKFTHTSESEPPKLTKAGIGGFVSTDAGVHEDIFTANANEKANVVDGADTVVSAGWRLHYADREPQSVVSLPMSHAEMLARNPDVVAAGPFDIGAGDAVTDNQAPFDRESFEERASICEFDGGLSRDEAEAIAWLEDDRRRCRHCLNLLPNGVCKVASPKGPVVANRGYRPIDILKRCEGYRPCPDDPDRRPGRERWPGLFQKGTNNE